MSFFRKLKNTTASGSRMRMRVKYGPRKMSGLGAKLFRPVRATWSWLNMAWSTQPVLFVSAVMAIAGKPTRKIEYEVFVVLTFDL